MRSRLFPCPASSHRQLRRRLQLPYRHRCRYMELSKSSPVIHRTRLKPFSRSTLPVAILGPCLDLVSQADIAMSDESGTQVLLYVYDLSNGFELRCQWPFWASRYPALLSRGRCTLRHPCFSQFGGIAPAIRLGASLYIRSIASARYADQRCLAHIHCRGWQGIFLWRRSSASYGWHHSIRRTCRHHLSGVRQIAVSCHISGLW